MSQSVPAVAVVANKRWILLGVCMQYARACMHVLCVPASMAMIQNFSYCELSR